MANYKDTLNILKTDFEMKANLNVKEPLMQDKWSSTNVYQTLLTQNKHNPQ
jgi:isoleucyl-tRNA synthetase